MRLSTRLGRGGGGAGLGGLAEVWALALLAPCGTGLAGFDVAAAAA